MHSVQDKVISVLAQTVDCNPEDISVNATLDALRIDSMELLQVGLDLEEHFGEAAYLGGDDLDEIETVQDLIDHISSRLF